MNNGDRLLALIEILRTKTDENHPIKTAELISELEKYGISTERKTIYRCIETLVENGFDIVQTRVPEQGYYLASREFENVEIRLLIDAVLAASFITQKKTDELVKKLEGLVSINQAKEIHSRVFIDNRVKSGNEHIYYSVDAISTAIEQNKKISLTYTKSGNSKVHVISPYAMAWNKDKFYLIGNISEYKNLIHLRLDKISKVEITKEDSRPFTEVSEYRNYFDSADYVSKHINMFGGEPEAVELFCTEKGYELLADQFDISSSVRKDDGIYVRVRTATGQGMVGFLAQCGGEIKVLSPHKLREDIRKHAESILALYKNEN